MRSTTLMCRRYRGRQRARHPQSAKNIDAWPYRNGLMIENTKPHAGSPSHNTPWFAQNIDAEACTCCWISAALPGSRTPRLRPRPEARPIFLGASTLEPEKQCLDKQFVRVGPRHLTHQASGSGDKFDLQVSKMCNPSRSVVLCRSLFPCCSPFPCSSLCTTFPSLPVCLSPLVCPVARSMRGRCELVLSVITRDIGDGTRRMEHVADASPVSASDARS